MFRLGLRLQPSSGGYVRAHSVVRNRNYSRILSFFGSPVSKAFLVRIFHWVAASGETMLYFSCWFLPPLPFAAGALTGSLRPDPLASLPWGFKSGANNTKMKSVKTH